VQKAKGSRARAHSEESCFGSGRATHARTSAIQTPIARNISSSFLRWAGSKTQLLPVIASYWDDSFDRYVEPFCGSASLFFAIRPRRALLSDLNHDLVGALRQVQLSGDSVAECLRRLPKNKSAYYAIRKQDPSSLSPTEQAARFIYLNALCFNGLYRVNTEGKFNVPYGTKHRQVSFDAASLRQASYTLRGAQVEHSDFEEIVDRAGDGDFIYLDPPYATGAHRTFVEYGQTIFSAKDLERLLAALKASAQRGAKFVLSYANVPEVQNMPASWSVKSVKARRNIAGFLDSRRLVSEVLISNIRVR
jgi:DNA adenine methylase